ncbi:MAG: hypothetical protein HY290_22560 [Planctomycetia bacterium]|nr:hypothetical protein [Planctomycetia bacterium]
MERALGSLGSNATARKKTELVLHEAWLWRNLCMGLLVVAAILTFGMAWHSVSSSWGKSDWRKFGYCSAALLEATVLLYRYLKTQRRHAVETLVWYANFSPRESTAVPEDGVAARV